MPLEGVDTIVGGASQYTYGLSNHLYAKRRSTIPGVPSLSREIVGVDLSQSYYSDQRSSLVDQQYVELHRRRRAEPLFADRVERPRHAVHRRERDDARRVRRPLSFAADDFGQRLTYSWTNRVQTTATWSKQFLIPQLSGFNVPANLGNSVGVSTNVRTMDNRFGGCTRSTTTWPTRRWCSSRSPASTTRSAAASRFSIRPTISAASAPCRSRPITASSCRSRSPASATSPRSTARSAARASAPRGFHLAEMSTSILVTGAAGFAGSHLLDRLARDGADVVAWHRPGGHAARGAARGGRRSICSMRSRSAARSRSCGRASCITAPARRTSAARGTRSSRRWPSTSAARIICSMRFGAPGVKARVVIPSSALVYAGRNAADRRCCARADESVRAEQAGAGARRPPRDRRRHRRDDRARVQSCRPAAGSLVRRVGIRAADCRHRSGPLGAGDRRRQPRRAARPDRRARHGPRLSADRRARAARAAPTTSARAARSPSAICWT